MMIHRQLIGLWAVLLLAPSAWTQEAGEEIIAKFKQSILDRRAAIKNGNIAVKGVSHRPKEANSLFSSNPAGTERSVNSKLNTSISLYIDRINGNYRHVENGEKYYNIDKKITVKKHYTESGYLNGRPVKYTPRNKNDKEVTGESDGYIIGYETQSFVITNLLSMEPFLYCIGACPSITCFSPSIANRRLTFDEIMSPSLDDYVVNLQGFVFLPSGKHAVIACYKGIEQQSRVEYIINLDMKMALSRMVIYSQHVPLHIFDDIIIREVNNNQYPVKWSHRTYAGDPLSMLSEKNYETETCLFNNDVIISESVIKAKDGDIFFKEKSSFILNGNAFIDAESINSGSLNLYLIISCIVLALAVMFLCWRRCSVKLNSK